MSSLSWRILKLYGMVLCIALSQMSYISFIWMGNWLLTSIIQFYDGEEMTFKTKERHPFWLSTNISAEKVYQSIHWLLIKKLLKNSFMLRSFSRAKILVIVAEINSLVWSVCCICWWCSVYNHEHLNHQDISRCYCLSVVRFAASSKLPILFIWRVSSMRLLPPTSSITPCSY